MRISYVQNPQTRATSLNMPLQTQLESLAQQFAQQIMNELLQASLDDLLAVRGGGATTRRNGNGRVRRSAGDLASTVDQIVGLLKKRPDGLRAEEIRLALGTESKDLPRPLAVAIESGRIKKTGQKRATTYFATGEVVRKGKKKG